MPSDLARGARIVAVVLAAAAATLLLALASGSEAIGPGRLFAILAGRDTSIHADVVLELRLPRALAAFAVGGLLALAGALMQVLLRNPLADPYVLGLAGGAGSGALGAMLLGLEAALVLGAAWAGALVSVALVLVCGGGWLGARNMPAADEPQRLLLIGVALATGWGALITLMLSLAPDANLRGMLYWLMGELDGSEAYAPALAALTLLALLALALAPDCNVLMRGGNFARALGVRVERLRVALMLLASAATAAAVTTAGTIGFVGLIVPNAVRLALGVDQRLTLPVSVLVGGSLLTLADTLARTVVAPAQLPVGAVIALAGVPAFVWLIMRRAEASG